MLKIWNVVLVIGAFALALFGTFLTRSGIISSIHSFTESSIGPWFLGFIGVVLAGLDPARPLAPAAAALEDAARVADLARGELPLQQPAARRLLPDDPLGRPLPDPDRGAARRAGDGRAAVLQLLPQGLRAAAAPADGHRAADRLAPGVAARAGEDVRVAGRRRARMRRRCCSRSAPARRSRASSATRSAPSCSRRSCSSSCAGRARGTRSAARLVARRLRLARRPQPAAVRRLRRPRVDRAARDRRRRLERLRHDRDAAAPARARRWRSAGYDLTLPRATRSREARTRRRSAPSWTSSADGESLGTLRPGKNRYFAEQQVSNEAAIRSDRLNGEDLFLIADQIDGDTVFLRVLVKPLVNLIWIAGLRLPRRRADRPLAGCPGAAPAGGPLRRPRGTRPRVSPRAPARRAAGGRRGRLRCGPVPAGEGAADARRAPRPTRRSPRRRSGIASSPSSRSSSSTTARARSPTRTTGAQV